MIMARFGLITRIALLVIGIEIAAFSALGWFYIDRFSTAAEDRVRSRLRVVGQMIANSELPVSAISVPQLVGDLVGAPYLDGMVIGGRGRVIASLQPGNLGRQAVDLPSFDARLLENGNPDEVIVADDDRLTFVAHLHREEGNASAYYTVITISTTELNSQKHAIALWGWVMSGLFILLSSVGIILVAQRLITRRINRSLTVLKEVETGDLEARIDVTSDDELGQLQHGINSMTSKVGALLYQHRRNEEEIGTILDGIADGVIAVASDGHILRCNPSAATLLDIDPSHWSGASILTLLPELAIQLGENWWLANESTTVQGRLHFEREGPDESLRSLELGHGLILDQDGSPAGAVLILQDVTERKRAEMQLRDAVERLTVSNAELERFAYVASHDLQEPLRTIVSFTQLLERRIGSVLPVQDRESFDFVIKAAKRMRLLINDLLSYSRVNARNIGFGTIFLRHACDAALSNLHESIAESGAEIVIGDLPQIQGDNIQMMQLFQNLIGNAIKFRNPDVVPRVEVTARQSEREWIISIADNGIGITETSQDIFEIFRRLHPENNLPGSGVGLAICKRIVQRHHGRIWFENRPDQGATFFFTLPVIGD